MVEIIREYHRKSSERNTLEKKGYGPVTYTDHYSDGSEVDGTEDFSLERYRKQVVTRNVYRPIGKLNRGGKMMWEYVGSVSARSARDCGRIARLVFAGQKISVRKH